MRAVVQRVTRGAVSTPGQPPRVIGAGFVVLLGVGADDTEEDAAYVAEKVCHLRVFPDAEGKMNRSLLEVGGQALVISQFTLYGDVRRGRRPSFARAAAPERARSSTRFSSRRCGRLGFTSKPAGFKPTCRSRSTTTVP